MRASMNPPFESIMPRPLPRQEDSPDELAMLVPNYAHREASTRLSQNGTLLFQDGTPLFQNGTLQRAMRPQPAKRSSFMSKSVELERSSHTAPSINIDNIDPIIK